jgi:transposase
MEILSRSFSNSIDAMRPPLFVRALTEPEQDTLEEALRSEEAFTLRRAQIVRLSSRGKRSPEISYDLGCSAQTVRNAIHAFNEEGLESLHRENPGPKDPGRIFGEEKREALMELAHQSPREFSKERPTWTLQLLAEVAFEEGLTERVVSHEAIRQAILEMGHSWQRAKDWIQSPDPQYALKKSSETA